MANEINIDLSGYVDKVGERVAPGRYRVVVAMAEEDVAKSGNRMINLGLRVVGGEFDNANIVDRLVLTEKSMFRVVAFLQAINIPTPKRNIRVGLDKIIGRTLDVDVEDGDPYNGRVKSEVRGYMRLPQSAAGTVAADDGFDAVLAAAEEIPEPSLVTEEAVDLGDAVDLADIDLDAVDLL